eukprot:13174988-Alexandrium_andersonii.AAC.1
MRRKRRNERCIGSRSRLAADGQEAARSRALEALAKRGGSSGRRRRCACAGGRGEAVAGAQQGPLASVAPLRHQATSSAAAASGPGCEGRVERRHSRN